MPSLRLRGRVRRAHPAAPVRSVRLRQVAATVIVFSALVGLAAVRSTQVQAAPVVIGDISRKWQSLRGTVNDPGEPLDIERPTFDGTGRAQEFQNGTISWHPNIGANYVKGDIRARWFRLGRENWGYPITDEWTTPQDRRGRFNHFAVMRGFDSTEERSIYWTPQTRAVEVYGAIRDFWGQNGWENGRALFPKEPEKNRADGAPGRIQVFEGEPIVWTPTDGAAFLAPDINRVWEYRTGSELAATRLVLKQNGNWEFSGTATNQFGDPKDVFIACAVRAQSGQVFQFSVQGHLKGYGSGQFPAPGRGVLAGQDMRIATAWPSISRSHQVQCRMGANTTGTSTLQDLEKGLRKGLGIVKEVFEVIKLGKDALTPIPSPPTPK
jgi:hypothetical protein